MSLTNTKTDGMAYELSGTKKISKGGNKRIAINAAEQLSSSRLAWILVKRHKVGLLAIGNIILVLNFVFPEWTQLLKSVL